MPVSSNVSHHQNPHRHSRHLFLEAQFLCHSNIAMLRQRYKVSSSSALRAAAHCAQSVHRLAAQCASNRAVHASQSLAAPGFTSKHRPTSVLKAATRISSAAFSQFVRVSLQSHLGSTGMHSVATVSTLQISNPKTFALRAAPSAASISAMSHFKQLCASKALANQSLNRTFCGVSQLGFISFSPNCLTPQNAG